ncbi:hypothetical protein FACS1894125_1550 [Actinomycetota bacterium]|nr:hypothetical protein FACS1894125_1550 [Actinomycetota bacterium]
MTVLKRMWSFLSDESSVVEVLQLKKSRLHEEHGTTTLLFCLVLVPVFIFSAIFVDGSRYMVSQAVKQAAERATLNSYLANFDKELNKVYGLLGTNQEMSSIPSLNPPSAKEIETWSGYNGGGAYKDTGPIEDKSQKGIFTMLNTNLGNADELPAPAPPTPPSSTAPVEPSLTIRDKNSGTWYNPATHYLNTVLHRGISKYSLIDYRVTLNCNDIEKEAARVIRAGDNYPGRPPYYHNIWPTWKAACTKWRTEVKNWNNATSEYNNVLKPNYEADVKKYKATKDSKSSNMLKISPTQVELKGVEKANLANPDVLRQQVVDYTKFRAPVQVTDDLASMFGAYKGIGQASKTFDKIFKGAKKVDKIIAEAVSLQERIAALQNSLISLNTKIDTFKQQRNYYNEAVNGVIKSYVYAQKVVDDINSALADNQKQKEIVDSQYEWNNEMLQDAMAEYSVPSKEAAQNSTVPDVKEAFTEYKISLDKKTNLENERNSLFTKLGTAKESLEKASYDMAAFDEQKLALTRENYKQIISEVSKIASLDKEEEVGDIPKVLTELNIFLADADDSDVRALLSAGKELKKDLNSESGFSDAAADKYETNIQMLRDYEKSLKVAKANIIGVLNQGLPNVEIADSKLTDLTVQNILDNYKYRVKYNNVSKIEEMPSLVLNFVFSGSMYESKWDYFDDFNKLKISSDNVRKEIVDKIINSKKSEDSGEKLSASGNKDLFSNLGEFFGRFTGLTQKLVPATGPNTQSYLERYGEYTIAGTAKTGSSENLQMSGLDAIISASGKLPSTMVDMFNVIYKIIDDPKQVRDTLYISEYMTTNFNNYSMSIPDDPDNMMSGYKVNPKMNRGAEAEYILSGQLGGNEVFWRVFNMRFAMNLLSAFLVPKMSKAIMEEFSKGLFGIVVGITKWLVYSLIESYLDMFNMVADASGGKFFKMGNDDWSAKPGELVNVIGKMAVNFKHAPKSPADIAKGYIKYNGPGYKHYLLLLYMIDFGGGNDESKRKMNNALIRMSDVIQSHLATSGTASNPEYDDKIDDKKVAISKTDNGFRMRKSYTHLTIKAEYETKPLFFNLFVDSKGKSAMFPDLPTNDVFSQGFKSSSQSMLGY